MGTISFEKFIIAVEIMHLNWKMYVNFALNADIPTYYLTHIIYIPYGYQYENNNNNNKKKLFLKFRHLWRYKTHHHISQMLSLICKVHENPVNIKYE